MGIPIGLQLYTLRNEAEQNFAAVLERVASLDYVGVETSSLHSMAAAQFRRRLDDLGLEVVAAFVPPPVGSEGSRVLDEQETLRNDVLVTSLGPDDFASLDAIDRAAERLNQAAELVRGRGMTLGYHNHWWEFESSPDGGTPFDLFMQRIDPNVFLEIDIYWLQTAGLDPVATLSQLGTRVRRLHIKDGPCPAEAPLSKTQTAVGSGNVDVPATLAAAPHVEWHIVELDEYDGDTFKAVQESYRYLTEHGLSHGRR